ncbi:MAG: DUF1338 domain-containing protein [Bacteroidales bacterium]|nr:DUF1338 domain-containing protein [Bacteroidales bacterium]
MIDKILDQLWRVYIEQNPQVKAVYDAFIERGEQVVNDHIAFRTFDLPEINISRLASVFQRNGYEMRGEYLFPEKKLYARHYVHKNPNYPKVFISQLELDSFSDNFKNIVKETVSKMDLNSLMSDDFIYSGVLWGDISMETYNLLRRESEYAAWLYANGFVANHFTVSINHLKTFNHGIREVNAFLKEKGFLMNANPDEIQGSAEKLLEQSSIKAGIQTKHFREGSFEIPGAYYEFAQRYYDADGKLFESFIADSANKIFESTDFYAPS